MSSKSLAIIASSVIAISIIIAAFILGFISILNNNSNSETQDPMFDISAFPFSDSNTTQLEEFPENSENFPGEVIECDTEEECQEMLQEIFGSESVIIKPGQTM